MITSDKDSLVDQDTPAKHKDECFDVPSTKFNGSIIDNNPNSPENSEFYLEIDASLGSSQNSQIILLKTLDSASTSHSYICASRDGHDLDTSIDSSKGGMLYCTNSQPIVNT